MISRSKVGIHETFVNETVLPHDGRECLIWPFYRLASGYGLIGVNGSQLIASRYICQLVHGAPPTPKHEAAHFCGNGHLGCVSPKHLRWATRTENQADRVLHGTAVRGRKHGAARLTEDDVGLIRAAGAAETNVSLAKMFGVSAAHIGQIRSRKKWAWLE